MENDETIAEQFMRVRNGGGAVAFLMAHPFEDLDDKMIRRFADGSCVGASELGVCVFASAEEARAARQVDAATARGYRALRGTTTGSSPAVGRRGGKWGRL